MRHAAGWGLRSFSVVLAAEDLGVDECQPDRAGRDPFGDEQAAIYGEARGRHLNGSVRDGLAGGLVDLEQDARLVLE